MLTVVLHLNATNSSLPVEVVSFLVFSDACCVFVSLFCLVFFLSFFLFLGGWGGIRYGRRYDFFSRGKFESLSTDKETQLRQGFALPSPRDSCCCIVFIESMVLCCVGLDWIVHTVVCKKRKSAVSYS